MKLDSYSRESHDNGQLVSVLISPPLTESFELTIARAVDLKNNGVSVRVLYCDGRHSGCVANPFKIKVLCGHCRRVRNRAFKKYFSEDETMSIDEFYPEHEDLELIKQNHKSFSDDIWRCVVSTILTFFRFDIENSMTSRDLRKVFFYHMSRNFNEYSKFIFFCVSNYLIKEESSKIEFFNGRIVPTKAVMCSAISTGSEYSVIEVSGHKKSIFIAPNASVHDLDYLISRLEKYIFNNAYNCELGNDFFINRRGGIETDARSFIEYQIHGLHQNYEGKDIFAIFISSPDEMEVSGDQWFTEASKDPVGFIVALRALLPIEYLIIVRMHPNQHGDRTGKTGAMINTLKKIDGIKLIRPQDKESTYELIDLSSYVLTFGSTVGLEATYWNKPSILAGRSLWERSGVAYIVRTPNDVIQLLQKKLEPLSKQCAIYVGSYYMDSKDESLVLSWSDEGKGGFYIKGTNYLKYKRRSLIYNVNAVLDKFLRFKL